MSNRIKAIVIDDEKQAREILNALIKDYCTEVDVIANAYSVKTGVECINTYQPDLVFLDIDMADGYGFEVLERSQYNNYSVVFTTAYSDFAAKAFKYAALHYLLKPIDIDELIESTERFKRTNSTITKSQLDTLKEGINAKPEKINFQINNDIIVVGLLDILYLSTEEGVSILHLKDKQIRLLPQSLNYYEELLQDNGFYRAHAKYLINLRNVAEFKSTGRVAEAKIVNNETVSISARKKSGFANALKAFRN